jgi:DNA processing protein
MTNTEAIILLNMVEGLGPKRIEFLLSNLESPKEVFTIRHKSLKPLLGEKLSGKLIEKRSSLEFRKELDLIAKEDIDVVTVLDSDYPSLLKETYDPPALLYLKGRRQDLNGICFGIVGSRKASVYGLTESEKFSLSLSYLGLVIVSGLAKGIDTYAHRGALKAGGLTVAVLGSGLNNIYPRENIDLAKDIANRGCVVSEFPINTPPLRENFPRRNRIISGLSLGILVVEAAKRSGALITARYALEQAREIFCLPGHIDSEQSRGTHELIKQGACLIDSVDDILQNLNIKPTLLQPEVHA